MRHLAFANVLLQHPAALVIVKATVVLALAGAAAVAAKGLSAARRHMLWLAALSSCVWLVLSSPIVPAIVIRTPMFAPTVVGAALPPTIVAARSNGSAATANVARVRGRFARTQPIRRAPLQSIPLPSHPLIALWIIGCGALLVRHATGFVRATRLARRASIASDDEATQELARATAAVGASRHVRLGYSAEVRTPITFGGAKPYVLLPTEARSWSAERRRAVLVHETAHIARGDWLSQTIGRLACELFWFHPLVWRAFARLRDEAERAADDCVLRSGMPALEYATHLLELAQRTINARPELVAIGIVSTDDLERRFVAMFDNQRSRTTVTARARVVTASFALAVVCPLASLRVGAPVHLTRNAPLSHVSLRRASLPHVPTSEPASATRPAAGARDGASLLHTPDLRPAGVGQSVQETSPSSIAAIEHPAPSPVVHPNFSGKWKQDTMKGPIVDFFMTDSTTIKQSANSISFESGGHLFDAPIYQRFDNVSFDGIESRGVAMTGSVEGSFTLGAVWAGDTLVLTSYAVVYGGGGAHDVFSIERMTLSPDKSTLLNTIVSYGDGKERWGGPNVFVLRRITP